ncbi:MAG: Oxidoreductase family, NAD-binding Rossmann fold protein [Clostridiales bacterium]|nr:Oxidoreductase family, NAD-binding Rossmann fold protein [Clostridiales bacterium]
MLKVGLIGIGFMGRGHLDNYLRLEREGFPIKLVAICDIDKNKFENRFLPGNIDVGNKAYDFSKYHLYTDIDEMLENEDLDYIDTPRPTYLHAEVAIKALNKGLNVLCEKPMSLSSKNCMDMIEASEKSNKKLMIAQCLRFWPAYEYIKECIETGRFGKVVSGSFFRGGSTPKWSYNDWYLKKELSGGCLFDQHIHDVDTINWLFGKPKSLSTIAKNVVEGSGYDILSTNYIYEDGKIINTQDDWTLNGDYGFQMRFRVNFEKGNVIYEHGKLKVNPNDSEGFIPDISNDDGYYREIKYFINSLINDTPIITADPRSCMETIIIAEAESHSADMGGKFIDLI